jgi:hypothetical protein
MQAFQRSSLDLRVAGRPRAPGGHNDPFADIAGGAKSPLESQNCTRFLNRPISTVLTPPLTVTGSVRSGTYCAVGQRCGPLPRGIPKYIVHGGQYAGILSPKLSNSSLICSLRMLREEDQRSLRRGGFGSGKGRFGLSEGVHAFPTEGRIKSVGRW